MAQYHQKNSQKSQDSANEFDNQKTTGHSWDEISEYDIPAPRWWLIVWVLCIIWAVIYWVFYPTWPTFSGNSKGKLNWSKFSQLQEQQKNKINLQEKYNQQINQLSFEEIKQNPELYNFALNGGKVAFKENCAACHGVGANGAKGYPNLNDDDWLWGGKIDDIYTTLLYGIRSNHEQARQNQMPSFGRDKILTRDQIKQVANFVLSLSKNNSESSVFEEGRKIFQANCVSCHGANGEGNKLMGAPRLNDQIWLYGNDQKDLFTTIYYARAGVMPYWQDRLENATIKQLTLYVHSLGGGEE